MVQKQIVKQKERVEEQAAKTREKVVRERLKEADKDIETGYLTMAELLNEAYHKEYFKGWGYDLMTDYVEKELDIKYRKVKYLIAIWDRIKSLDLPKEKLAEIAKLGWSKVKDLAAVATKKNYEKLVKQAKEISSRELTERVKVMRKTGGARLPQAPSTLKITFSLGESEHRIVMEALNEAKKLCNSDDLALGLEMICQDWLGWKGAKPESTSLEDHVEFLEKVYPVKISFKIVEKPKREVEKPPAEKRKSKEKERVPDEPEEEEAGASIDELLGQA